MTVHYAAGFLFDPALGSVILERKERPEWMKGLWNAVGGHIEEGEASGQAMSREWAEEVDCDIIPAWTPFVKLAGKGFDCTFFYAVAEFSQATARTHETVLVWTLPLLSTVPTIPNVRWLIEMALSMAGSREKATFFDVAEHGTNQENLP